MLRRRRAGQGDEAGLGPTVELGGTGRRVPLLAFQGGVESLLDEASADPLDHRDMDFQGVGDPPVGPVQAVVGGVGLEQDAGVGQLASGALAGGDEVVERLAFVGGEGDFEASS